MSDSINKKLKLDDDTLENKSIVYVGITSLIRKELYNFFQVSFSIQNYLTSKTRTFSDEDMEKLIEKIYSIVKTN